MKKIIFGMAAAAAVSAFAQIESANVVGYSTGSTGANNNFITISFSDVGYNTTDIQAIKLSDGGAGMIGWGGEMFSIWKGLPTVEEGSEFLYNDPSMDPAGEAEDFYWGDANFAPVAFSVAQGQGVVVNCPEGIEISTLGQVTDGKISFTSEANNNFTGNPFAAPIDIQAIKISDDGAGMIGWGGEMFSIWKGLPTVEEGSEFLYNDPSMDPAGEAEDFYWGDGNYAPVSYSIAAGQGVVINCAEGLEISIAAPYAL